MSSHPRVFVRARSARPFFARHPWVFATSIEKVEGEPSPGDVVDVVTHDGKPIARGLFNPRSGIRVRLLRWDQGEIDETWFRERIASAIRWRLDGLGLGGERAAYRAIFSESDGLPGLTVDVLNRHAVVQFGSLGLYLRKDLIIESIRAALPDLDGLLVRGDRSIAEPEGLHIEDSLAWGRFPEGEYTIQENGLTYVVDLVTGQKTGFYLDQRDNRAAVGRYARGRRVLDLYCYSGGFSLNAARCGASSTLGIDSSRPAVDLARRNAVLNGVKNARFEESDVGDAIELLRASEERFGMILCDPPKFVRNPKGLEKGLRAYLKLNQAVVELLEPNGILVTCSCSGSVDPELFVQMIGQVAEQTRRSIQILERRGQAVDHPVSASCLETEYLKCLVCRVV